MNTRNSECRAVVADVDHAIIAITKSLLLQSRHIYACGASSHAATWALLKTVEPEIILIAHAPPTLDAPQLTRDLRRSDLLARKAPVVMLADRPTASEIKAARDAGVHEVLRKPFSINDLILRVDAVMLKKRDWVEGVDYTGPNRRRFNSVEYMGQRKRRIDKEEALSVEDRRIGQALRIMKSAIQAIDTDPCQALRVLNAQADELQDAAVAAADFALAGSTQKLKAYLDKAAKVGRFDSQRFASDLDGIFAPPSEQFALRKRILSTS